MWIKDKLQKHLVLRITYTCTRLFCLRLDVYSLTKIQYLQIEPSTKGTHISESMMLKMFYLYGFIRWTKCIWWAIKNNYLLIYQILVRSWMNSCSQKWSRNYLQLEKSLALMKLSIKKYLVYSVYCARPLGLLFKLSSFFNLALFSQWIHNVKQKKLTSSYM